MNDNLAKILIVWCTFGLFGLVLLLGGIKIIVSNRKFIRTALVADGVIVALEARSSDKGGMLYSPVVEFVDKEDRKIRFVSNIFESDCPYEKGDHVQVCYDQNFDRMEITDTLKEPTIPLVVIFLGGLFVVITIGTTLMFIL